MGQPMDRIEDPNQLLRVVVQELIHVIGSQTVMAAH